MNVRAKKGETRQRWNDVVIKVLHKPENRTDVIATTTEAFCFLPMQAHFCWKPSRAALGTTAGPRDYSSRNGAAFPPRTIYDWYVGRRAQVARLRMTEENRPERVLHRKYILCRKRRTLPTEDWCGRYSHALAYQPSCFQCPQFPRRGCGIAACYHRYGSTCSSLPRYTSYWSTLQQIRRHSEGLGSTK